MKGFIEYCKRVAYLFTYFLRGEKRVCIILVKDNFANYEGNQAKTKIKDEGMRATLPRSNE